MKEKIIILVMAIFIIGFFFHFVSAVEYDVGGGIGVNIQAGNISQNQSNNQLNQTTSQADNTPASANNNYESDNSNNNNVNLNENTGNLIENKNQNSGINEENKISENNLIILSKNNKNNEKQEINNKFFGFSLIINLFLLLSLTIMLIKSSSKLRIRE